MKGIGAKGIIAGVLVGLWTQSAAAVELVDGTNSADTIIVGMIKRAGDALPEAYACVDTGGVATWIDLGGSSGLIYSGNVAGYDGNDTIKIVSSKGLSGTAACSVAGQTWYELLYNSHWLDVLAGAGADLVDDGGGTHDTHVFAGSGNDDVFQESTSGQARGEDGDDDMFGYVPGNVDYMLGGEGADCLFTHDSSVNTTWFLCGNGADETTLPAASRPADCETTVPNC